MSDRRDLLLSEEEVDTLWSTLPPTVLNGDYAILLRCALEQDETHLFPVGCTEMVKYGLACVPPSTLYLLQRFATGTSGVSVNFHVDIGSFPELTAQTCSNTCRLLLPDFHDINQFRDWAMMTTKVILDTIQLFQTSEVRLRAWGIA